MKRTGMMSDSDDSTEDLIIKDDDTFAPNVTLSTENNLNYVVKIPRRNGKGHKTITRFLAVLIFLLALVCVVLLCLYFHEKQLNTKLTSTSEKYCTSSECVESAAFINSALDETVNPCDDFYLYSCGGWLFKNPIPDGKSKWGVDTALWNMNLQTMKMELHNTTINENTFKSKAKYSAFKLYRSCNNTTTIKKLGAKPLVTMLQKLGGFVNNDQPFNKTKLMEALTRMYNVSYMFPFFNVFVDADDKDSSSNILQVRI